VRQVSARVMRWISTQDSPQGLAAGGPQPGHIFRRAGDPFSLIVALWLVQDPGNLGGVIRTADYFGVDEIWLGPGSADPYGPKALRGSMGAAFRMPVVRTTELGGRIARFRGEGAEVWAAVVGDDRAETSIGASGARILMIGGESRGLEARELELADHRVRIPGARRSESLNLAVATGILVYLATVGRWNADKGTER